MFCVRFNKSLHRGEMAEWLKAHAWKACIPQGIQGSNPCLSAIPCSRASKSIQISDTNPGKRWGFVFMRPSAYYGSHATVMVFLMVSA